MINNSQFINELCKINNIFELKEILSDLTQQLCLKQFWHMIAPNKFLSKERQNLLAINDFPQEFEDEYIRGKKRAFECPVLTYVYQYSQQPILWKEMLNFPNLTDRQHLAMEWYSLYNFNEGICFPIHEKGTEYAVLTFILNETIKLSSEEISTIRNHISVLGNLIHNKYKECLNVSTGNSKLRLSKREYECLLWTARGKTAWEISMILSLSEYTVNEYLKNTMRKFDCINKTTLVSKAILSNHLLYTDIDL